MQHHGHQHIDEFSVSDIRHTLHEIWRVVRARRWLFVLPACAVATLAFVASLGVPRLYDGGAIVKSEHDPVFSMVNATVWSKPFSEIRDRMKTAIKDPDLIEAAIREQGLLDDLERYPDGSLTPAAQRQRDRLVSEIANGLSTKTISETDNERIIQITMRHPRREIIPGMLESIRSRYVPKATDMAVHVLEDVQAFLRAEADKSRDRIAQLNQRLVEFELKYPGIDPDRPDRTQAEQTKLIIEKVDAENEVQDLRLYEAELRNALAMLDGNGTSRPTAPRPIPNPRRAAIIEDIQRLSDEIEQGMTQKQMTEAHPAIIRAREQIALRRMELDETPATISETVTVEGEASRIAALDETRRQFDKLAARVAAKDRRLAAVVSRLKDIDHSRALAMEYRQPYHKTKAEIARLTSELKQWQEQIAPVSQVLYLDNKDRSVRFSAIQDSWVTPTPVTPKMSLVMLICTGLGAAVGIIAVLIAELIDHSYRTAKQLTTSLGLPVIESIDEIMTLTATRRRLIRKVLVMPVAVMVAGTAALTSGMLAYMSLENPTQYGTYADMTRQTINRLVESD